MQYNKSFLFLSQSLYSELTISERLCKTNVTQLTTLCFEFGFCSSHSMSSEPDDGNWWWHGKVALSPTTFFISVWAPAVSRLNRTEEREERGREMSDGDRGSIQTWDKRQMLRIGRKQNRADRGNWDGKTQREIWPRIPITIWQMLRYVSPGHCRETEWGFLLIQEIDFVMRGQREVLWWSLSITPFDKGKNTILFTQTAAGELWPGMERYTAFDIVWTRTHLLKRELKRYSTAMESLELPTFSKWSWQNGKQISTLSATIANVTCNHNYTHTQESTVYRHREELGLQGECVCTSEWLWALARLSGPVSRRGSSKANLLEDAGLPGGLEWN